MVQTKIRFFKADTDAKGLKREEAGGQRGKAEVAKKLKLHLEKQTDGPGPGHRKEPHCPQRHTCQEAAAVSAVPSPCFPYRSVHGCQEWPPAARCCDELHQHSTADVTDSHLYQISTSTLNIQFEKIYKYIYMFCKSVLDRLPALVVRDAFQKSRAARLCMAHCL